MPLHAFFLCAPPLLIAVLFGVLQHHVILARKIYFLKLSLSSNPRLNINLHSYYFLQSRTIHYESSLFRALLLITEWASLMLLPLSTLIAFQLKFLPYHDVLTTWFHRLCFAMGLCVIIIMFALIRFATIPTLSALARYMSTKSGMAAAFFWCLSLIFTFCIATIPDERIDRLLVRLWPVPVPWGEETDDWESSGFPPYRVSFGPTALLFDGDVSLTSGTAISLFSRNLVIVNHDILRGVSGTEWPLLSLRGRDISYGVFDRTNLRGVDFRGARADGSRFTDARLERANFKYASLNGADFRGASLTGADFQWAELNGAYFAGGELAAARFNGASLIGAHLANQFLIATDFSGSDLTGADLRGVWFFDTQLWRSTLNGTKLSHARIWFTEYPWSGVSDERAPPAHIAIDELEISPPPNNINLKVVGFDYINGARQKTVDSIVGCLQGSSKRDFGMERLGESQSLGEFGIATT